MQRKTWIGLVLLSTAGVACEEETILTSQEPPVMAPEPPVTAPEPPVTAPEPPVVAPLGPPTELTSLQRGANGWCWFSEMRRAVAHDVERTVVAVGHHRACSTRVDEIEVYESPSTAEALAPMVLHTSVYSSASLPEAWGRGAPGQITAMRDGTGGFHVAVPLREGSRGWEADQVRHASMAASGVWSSMVLGPSSAKLQQEQGNTRGMNYAGFDAISLGWDPSTASVAFLAIDNAWFATRYNVVEAVRAPSGGGWTLAAPVHTRVNDTVDRSALGGADQDFDGNAGVQVWVDKHTCRIYGRERSAGQWAATIDIPIADAPCSGTPRDYYGFQSTVDVAYVDGEPEIWMMLRGQAARDIEVQRHRREAGQWTATSWRRPWSTGYYYPKLFVLDGSRPLVLYRDATDRSIGYFDPKTGADTMLYLSPSQVRQIDVAKHDPTILVWTEQTSPTGTERLMAADLAL